MRDKMGERIPEMRKGRVVLTRRDPYILKLLAGLDVDGINIDELLRFSKRWWALRDEWDIDRRPRGIFGSRLIRRDEADGMLRRELSAQAAGGAE